VFDAAVVAESTGLRLFLCRRPSDVASRVRRRGCSLEPEPFDDLADEPHVLGIRGGHAARRGRIENFAVDTGMPVG
jgi:hypothetical protein